MSQFHCIFMEKDSRFGSVNSGRGCDMAGCGLNVGNRDTSIKAQYQSWPLTAGRQWQPQPELDQMVAGTVGAAQYPLCWPSGMRDAFAGGNPIVTILPFAQIAQRPVGHFGVIDTSQLCSGQTETKVQRAAFNLNEAHKRQVTRDVVGFDVRPFRHISAGCLLVPIIEEMPLFRQGQLSPKRLEKIPIPHFNNFPYVAPRVLKPYRGTLNFLANTT